MGVYTGELEGRKMATTDKVKPDKVDAEACDWLVRHSAGDLSADEQARFQQWLAADPDHQHAWQACWLAWEDIAQMTDFKDTEPLQSETLWGRLRGVGPWLRPMWGVAAIMVVLAVAFWLSPSDDTTSSGFAALYSTSVAEIRDQQLPDGSRVTLGAKSSIGWSGPGGERRVTLLEGEAYFAVVADTTRPFVVQTGDTRVRVLGTEFDVHRGPAMVRVAVAEGAVQVSRISTEAQPQKMAANVHQLRAGEQIIAAHGQPLGKVQNIGVSLAGDWRNGRLVYENVTLDEVIADANRYYDGEIQFASDDLRQLKITASFQTTEIDPFINTLLQALPVRVARPKPGRIVLW